MIKCYIDGKETVPSMKEGLKIVIENPNMREKSSYTYDITFPLDILENLECFSGISHVSVSIRNRTFDDCRLMVNDRMLFRGKGLVTVVTRDEVKLQIVQEVQQEVPKVFSDMFIDHVKYPAVDRRFKQAVFTGGGSSFEGGKHYLVEWTDARPELNETRFLGEKGKYTFVQTLKGDSTGEDVEDFVNVCCSMSDFKGWPLYNLAVQPNLMFVLKHILASAGYNADLSAINREPWSDLYVCSSNVTLDIAEALPHWTAGKFLTELEKLFNIRFEWRGSQVGIVKLWESEASQQVVIEDEDDFEKNYDEDGQEYADTSNLSYSLADTHDPRDTVKSEVVRKYGIRKFSSLTEIKKAVDAMGDREKRTSFFAVPDWPELYYYHEKTDDSDFDRLEGMGWFRPLFRDLSSDSETELCITPVAIEHEEVSFRPILSPIFDLYYTKEVKRVDFAYPVINTKEGHDDYIPVQDVVEDGSDMEDSEDESPMEIMFVGPYETIYLYMKVSSGSAENVAIPKAQTKSYVFNLTQKMGSLSLNSSNKLVSVGDFHVTQLQIDSASKFNKHEELIRKFIADEVPSVSRVFIIGNKRYVAKQLEILVNDEGIAHEITGHFYEIL